MKAAKDNQTRGYVVLTAVVFFMVISLTIVLGIAEPIVRQIAIANDFFQSKTSYFTAEAASEDIYYRAKNSLNVPSSSTLALNNSSANTTIVPTGSGTEKITSTGNTNNRIRVVVKDLTVTNGFSFNYGVQVDAGGLAMSNSARVLGNVYANGTITGGTGENDPNGCNGSANPKKYNCILGSAVSATGSGSVNNIHATSSLYAHSITNAATDADAYYASTLTNTTVTGTKHSGSADQQLATMPISDSLINQWESNATAGNVINNTSSPDKCSGGTFSINSDRSLGPVEIDCDLVIKKDNTQITLLGTVWVKGNISIQNNPVFHVDNSMGDKSVVLIADNPSNRAGSGQATISNSPQFFGSYNAQGQANPDSYVMLLSQSTNQASGGAITVSNNVIGNLLVYAAHGSIELDNSATLREVTAYQLTLKNSATVIYQIGLQQPIFASGPGGKWKIKRWKESK